MAEHYRNPGEAIGDLNRARVKAWFSDHLGGTRKECAKALGLSQMAVGRHVRALRDEWSEANQKGDSAPSGTRI